MPPTLREVQASQTTGVTRVREQLAEVNGLLKAAAISSEKLTTSEEWNRYLERLQPLLEQAKHECTQWLSRLSGAATETDVRVAQFNYQAWNSRYNTLQEVMLMPKAIIEAHHEQAGTVQH